MNGHASIAVLERETVGQEPVFNEVKKELIPNSSTVQLKDTLMEISYTFRNGEITEDHAVQMVGLFLDKAAKEIDSYYLGMAMAIFGQSGSASGVQAVFDNIPGMVAIEAVSYARSLSGGEYAIDPKISMPSYA